MHYNEDLTEKGMIIGPPLSVITCLDHIKELKEHTDTESSKLPQIQILQEVAFYSFMKEGEDVIGYFENLSLHLAKESLPKCLDAFLKANNLNYYASPKPALDIFSLLKDGTAKPVMAYL
jgi:hypothetical protein